MRIDDSPHESLKLEDDVGDVEYCQQPAVPVAYQMEVFLHAGDFGIANIRAIEERKEICRDRRWLARCTYHVIGLAGSTVV
jgi:hypothetical protein